MREFFVERCLFRIALRCSVSRALILFSVLSIFSLTDFLLLPRFFDLFFSGIALSSLYATFPLPFLPRTFFFEKRIRYDG